MKIRYLDQHSKVLWYSLLWFRASWVILAPRFFSKSSKTADLGSFPRQPCLVGARSSVFLASLRRPCFD